MVESKMSRHDMIVELVSDQISSIEVMVRDGERADLERWLAPILHKELAEELMNEDDSAVAARYEAELGEMPDGWEEGDGE